MKRIKRISLSLPVLLLVVLAIVNYSCEDSDDDQCESEEICEADFSFCSSDDKNYYLYVNEKYYCDEPFVDVESSCDDAMDDLYSDMCPTTSSVETKAALILKTQKMMDLIVMSVSL